MKKIIVLFLMLVLISSVAHAGIFDWITGRVTNDQEENQSTEDPAEIRRIKREQANTCVFDEATQTKICDPPEVPDTRILFKEKITCKFLNSNFTHFCYNINLQDLSCTGTGSCVMNIEEKFLPTVVNKVGILACDEVVYATIDNADETIEFNCEKSKAEKYLGQVDCIYYNATVKCNVTTLDYGNDCVYDEATQTEKCTIYQYITEQMTCKFLGSTSTQTCYLVDQRTGGGTQCSGTDSCTMTVRATQSSYLKACGQVAHPTLDEVDETVEFDCENYKVENDPQFRNDCVFDEATQTRMCYPSDYPAVPVEKETIVNPKVKGLENAILKIENNETKAHLEEVLAKIQDKRKEQLAKLENIEIEKDEKTNKTIIKGEGKAKFLGVISTSKDYEYEVDEQGNVQKHGKAFDFLFKKEDPIDTP